MASVANRAQSNQLVLAEIKALLKPVPTFVKVFVKCVESLPVFGAKIVSIPANSVDYVVEIFEDLAAVQAQQCTPNDCVATVPEWWQVRFEGGIEQLILSYRELKSDGSIGNDWYPITIPHPQNKVKTTAKLTTEYVKGNWQILLTLNDNSKVILNAETESGGLDFLKNQIVPLIEPAFLTKAKIKTSHFPDQGFTVLKVIHQSTDYYATGQRKTKPTWRARVNYP